MFHNKVDFVKTVLSAPHVITDILPAFIPYSVVVAGFAAFVVWNGGIVLGKAFSERAASCHTDRLSGDKSNHVPAFHIPQVYYFVGFSSILGWPVLVGGKRGTRSLLQDIWKRMFGSKRQVDPK